MSRSDPTVAVVGGGITGLAAAYELGRAGIRDVLVVEASERLGGKLKTDEIDGVRVEAGADSFVARGAALELCEELGITHELISPDRFGANIWLDGRLRSLPPDAVLGIPLSPRAARRARFLTVAGAARAYADLVLPRSFGDRDVSVAELIRRRLGAQVFDRMVDPVLAGMRAGRPERMSVRAALPDVDAATRASRSLLRGLRRSRPDTGGPPAFLAPRSGMQRIVQRTAEELDGDVVTGDRVEEVVAQDGRWRLQLGRGSVVADALILCVPSLAAADLLSKIDAELASDLRRIRFASAALATLVYPAGSIEFPEGSGILVPSGGSATIAGATFYSVKWPHTRPPDGRIVMRAFVGRAGRDAALELDDHDLGERVAGDLDRMLNPRAAPTLARITRWPDSLPEYEVGHLDLVASIEHSLRHLGNIAVAGAAYRGSGVPDCIGQGRDAARAVDIRLDAARR